ncbi:MAG: NTP transferase domain-containing protein [Verrucomicrobiota bacterium]|nr:NTP transferase domain-containing protein [Verrucomicrobiota bacterium]
MKVRDALILMAGAGSRLGSSKTAKPLLPIAGRPLISYALDALKGVGVERLHVVLGANPDALASQLRPLVEPEMELNAIHNPEWRKQNGVSVLQAADAIAAPFLLAMADHLFQPSIIADLIARSDTTRLNLAVDRKIESIFDLDDAMKVQTSGGKVVAISKTLSDFDAIDTGLFLCPNELFDYLRGALHDGDCSLADGVRLMAADGKVQAIDIGDAWWQDVDTPEMLQRAEAESARLFG